MGWYASWRKTRKHQETWSWRQSCINRISDSAEILDSNQNISPPPNQEIWDEPELDGKIELGKWMNFRKGYWGYVCNFY